MEKFKEMTNEALIALHENANIQYYHVGEPIMTDSEFDALEKEMESRGIDTKTLKNAQYGETTKHKTLMPSLKKVNVKGDFNQTFLDKIITLLKKSKAFVSGQTLALDFKSDGVAINAMFENGQFTKAVTRGNYFEGRDVTDKVRHLIPEVIPSDITEVRYECVMLWSVFNQKYSEEYSHPRNLVGGILNDEDIMDKRKYDLRLVPLNGVQNGKFLAGVHIPRLKETDMSLRTHLLGYEDLLDLEKFTRIYESMLKMREGLDVPNDGLVLSCIDNVDVNDTDGKKYPYHSVSIKFPPKGAVTTVKEIVWNLKKAGEYVPVIMLEPVMIDGRKIVKTHGFNHGFVTSNGINKGAKVRVDIAGDIIPYLQETIERSEVTDWNLPEDSFIDGCHLYTNDADAVKLERFVYGALKLELKDFGDSFYRKVASYYNYDIFNIFIRHITCKEGLIELGLGKRTAEKFVQRVNEKKTLHLDKAIHAMAIPNCGEGTSEQVAKYLAKEVIGVDSEKYDVEYDFARKHKETVKSCTEGDLKEKIMNIYKKYSSEGVMTSLVILPAYEKKQITSGGEEVKYIMTGSPKKFGFATKAEFQKTLPDNYTVVKKITDATLLVTDNLEGTSSKMKKATSMGIDIKSYDQF